MGPRSKIGTWGRVSPSRWQDQGALSLVQNSDSDSICAHLTIIIYLVSLKNICIPV